MKEKIRNILVGILVGTVAFPTITLGGTFVVSLIQGKTPEEAVQILAEQMDVLIGRVEVLETGHEAQEQDIQEAQESIQEEQEKLEAQAESIRATQEALKRERAIQDAYQEFRRAYDKVWLYGKDEEGTIEDTRMYCEDAIEEGNQAKADNFCPLADELERTWEAYQDLLSQEATSTEN